MARDTYIIRPKVPPRAEPKPITREDRIAAMAKVILGDVARNLTDRHPTTPRKPFHKK